MKRFWIFACVVAIAAAGAWSYRARLLPYAASLGIPLPAALAAADRKADTDGARPQAETAQGGGGQHHKGGGRGDGAPPSVKTVTVQRARLPLDVGATGFAVAADTTSIAPLQAGLVTFVAAKDGATVKQGDLILKLDDRIARAAVDKDTATLAADKAALEEAEAAFQRAGNLVKQNAQAQQVLDQARAARDAASAKRDADRATLEADQVSLEHMDIRAPFDGRLGDIAASPGAYLSAGVSITTITRYDPIEVSYRLPQRYLPELRRGLKAETPVDVDPAATGGQAMTGTLRFYDNQVDQASGTVLAKAEFANGEGLLWPGQTVNVVTRFQPEGDMVVVPTVAVRPGPSGDFVYTLDGDGKTHVTPVQVARSNGDMTGIAKGLEAGARVIVEGQLQLSDGQKVIDGGAKPSDAVADAKTAAKTDPKTDPKTDAGP